MSGIAKSLQAYEAWMRQAARPRDRRKDRYRPQAREDGRKPVRVPARHLLALGRDDPGGLPGPGGRARRARRRRHPPRELRHLARRRRPAGVGRQRLRRGGRRCPTRSTSSGSRPARCWRSRNGRSPRRRSARPSSRAIAWGWARRRRSCSTATGPGCASCWWSPTRQRAKFWEQDRGGQAHACAARAIGEALAAAMPEPGLKMWTARRIAGTGSLGRPRWIGVADWQGAPVVREAKAALPSGWELARGRAGAASAARSSPADATGPGTPGIASKGNARAPALAQQPQGRGREGGRRRCSRTTCCSAMGLELANVHLGAGNRRDAILRDLASRKADWLLANAKRAAAAVAAEFEAWKAR